MNLHVSMVTMSNVMPVKEEVKSSSVSTRRRECVVNAMSVVSNPRSTSLTMTTWLVDER